MERKKIINMQEKKEAKKISNFIENNTEVKEYMFMFYTSPTEFYYLMDGLDSHKSLNMGVSVFNILIERVLKLGNFTSRQNKLLNDFNESHKRALKKFKKGMDELYKEETKGIKSTGVVFRGKVK